MKGHAKPANGGTLVAVDGVNGAAIAAAARKAIAAVSRPRRGGVSYWDASGIFGDLVVADDVAGTPSARTLLLLYAADLAFRLRWEIRPALEQGRTVVAAPYVATAVAFGRAAGLEDEWLLNLFGFAPPAAESRSVATSVKGKKPDRAGFIEFGCERLAERPDGPKSKDLLARARTYLKR